PAPAAVLGIDVQRAGAELEQTLQHLHRLTQTASTGEGAIELDAAAAWHASEFDTRKVLAHSNLKIRKRLVVLQLDIEARLHVLDEPGFHEQGIHLAVGLDEIDVGDDLDQVAGARILGGRFREVVGGAIAEVLRLADVNDPALVILHQIDAGRGRELFDL